jgi:hypothetical protein
VTDYGSYPPPLPAGCNADGSNILTGVQYSTGAQTVTNLRDFVPTPAGGQTITMTWTGFAPGCESAGISLSIKLSPTATTFDPSANQYLTDFSYCGPDGPLCTAPFTLTLVMPGADRVPCWQLDAAIGPPLAVVGPDGSFYGNLNGVRNMLISAQNGGVGNCGTYPRCVGAADPGLPADSPLCAPVAPCSSDPDIPADDPACDPCPTNPSIPASSPDCQPGPRPTPCSSNPAIPADDPACEPCSSNPSIPASDAACRPCSSNPSIPASDAACQPCASNPAIPASDPGCAPPPRPAPCSSDPQLPADDPACRPCSSNPSIPASNAACQPCSTNPAIPASDPACAPPARPATCSTDPNLPASDPRCCATGFRLDPATGQCVAVAGTTVSRALPVTGARDVERQLTLVGALLMAGSLMLFFLRNREWSSLHS